MKKPKADAPSARASIQGSEVGIWHSGNFATACCKNRLEKEIATARGKNHFNASTELLGRIRAEVLPQRA